MKSSITTEEAHLRVVVLAGEGMSRRAIARAVGISRNTVKQILNSQQEQRDNPHSALPTPAKRAARPKKTDAFETRIKELLKRFNGITAQRVFEILKSDDNAYDGGYTAIKTTVRTLRPRPKKTPSRKPATTKPGAMAESDWSPYDIHCTTGADLHIEAFSYTLPLSRRPAYYVTDNYGVHALMAGHVATFQRFNGLAKCCKYDGQKAVAIRWEGRQPIYNLRFLAFCAHYRMRPWALRGNPNFRPNVERSFLTFERSFLNGREFRDMADLREQMARWMDEVVDQRRNKGTTPLERFAEEESHLLPLPRHPYDTARVVYRTCAIDGYVAYEGNRYAVPYEHVTDILPVRITQDESSSMAQTLPVSPTTNSCQRAPSSRPTWSAHTTPKTDRDHGGAA